MAAAEATAIIPAAAALATAAADTEDKCGKTPAAHAYDKKKDNKKKDNKKKDNKKSTHDGWVLFVVVL